MSSTIIFPLPLPIHIAFGIFGVIFFLIMYRKKGYFYYLLLSASIASTFLVYLCTDKMSRALLGFEELALYIAILVFLFIAKKKEEKAAAQAEAQSENENSNS